jgi:TetR/AcrR family transcriptional regulator, transcriptional repressor of aconitase
VPKVSEAHREQRRSQILAGARRAFSEHGYFGTNVARLETEIGLSRGAIFNYFPSKLDLFTALAQEDRARMGELWLERGFEAIVRHVGEDDPEWIGVYLEVGRLLRTDPALRERWATLSNDVQDRIVARYVELQESGEIRSDVSYETVLRFLGVVLDGLVTQQGAGFPVDVAGTLELVRSALAPE